MNFTNSFWHFCEIHIMRIVRCSALFRKVYAYVLSPSPNTVMGTEQGCKVDIGVGFEGPENDIIYEPQIWSREKLEEHNANS